jgi:hypothetical protein
LNQKLLKAIKKLENLEDGILIILRRIKMKKYKIAFKKENNKIMFGCCDFLNDGSFIEVFLDGNKKAFIAKDQICYMIENDNNNNFKFTKEDN